MPRLSVLNHPVHPILQAIAASLLPASTTFDALARLGVDAATGDEATMPEETAEAFLEFWQEGTTTHFREEEEVLLPVLARYREDLLGREPVVEMLLQHARIRGLVMGLSDEVKGESVR